VTARPVDTAALRATVKIIVVFEYIIRNPAADRLFFDFDDKTITSKTPAKWLNIFGCDLKFPADLLELFPQEIGIHKDSLSVSG
jgi:hypothetical protein